MFKYTYKVYMSQSDYLTLKKIKTQLTMNKLPSLLEYNDYYHYTNFSLEKSIVNNNITYNLLPLQDTTNIYNIVNKNIENNKCSFPICMNTNTRPNRLLNHHTNRFSNVPLNIKKITLNTKVKHCCA